MICGQLISLNSSVPNGSRNRHIEIEIGETVLDLCCLMAIPQLKSFSFVHETKNWILIIIIITNIYTLGALVKRS
jgi:hypothetical protein